MKTELLAVFGNPAHLRMALRSRAPKMLMHPKVLSVLAVCSLLFSFEIQLKAKDTGVHFPGLMISSASEGTRVTWSGMAIVEMKGNRYLRFRSSPNDEKWIGAESSPMDLGWAYRDIGTKGMVVSEVKTHIDPEHNRFNIEVIGHKPGVTNSRITTVLEGRWIASEARFMYTLSSRLSCPLEAWYEKSTSKLRGPASRGSKLWIEPLDFCLEGISITERMISPDKSMRSAPLNYKWFVRTLDGKNWEKWPKIHIPFPVRKGDYMTIRDVNGLMSEGSCFGFMDGERGGWIMKILKTSAPIYHEICWSRFDVHLLMEGAMPPRASLDSLDLGYSFEFTPIAPESAEAIVSAAQELPWRHAREYQDLALFSWNNRFDALITDVPSEKTAEHMLWWPSDYNCFRDGTVGADDNYSLSIRRQSSEAKPSAWSTLCWGYPFNSQPKGKRRYRFSAMVKTKDCIGEVRLGHYSSKESIGDVYYGGSKSHNRDGSANTIDIVWEYSHSLRGTSDWTPLSVEFEVKHYSSTLILENTGQGQCWFDNVKLEVIGGSDVR